MKVTLGYMIGGGVVALLMVGISIAWWWPRIASNKAGLQYLALVTAYTTFALVNSLVGIGFRWTPAEVWAADLSLFIFFGMILGIVYTPRFALVSLSGTGFLVWHLWRPQDVLLNIALNLTLVGLIYLLAPLGWLPKVGRPP